MNLDFLLICFKLTNKTLTKDKTEKTKHDLYLKKYKVYTKKSLTNKVNSVKIAPTQQNQTQKKYLAVSLTY